MLSRKGGGQDGDREQRLSLIALRFFSRDDLTVKRPASDKRGLHFRALVFATKGQCDDVAIQDLEVAVAGFLLLSPESVCLDQDRQAVFSGRQLPLIDEGFPDLATIKLDRNVSLPAL